MELHYRRHWVDSSPAVANGVVYVLSSGGSDFYGNFYALNATTGAKKWTYSIQSRFSSSSSPAVANGVVYVGDDVCNVYALDAATGAKLWSHNLGPYVIETTPAVANGVVYVAMGDVYALDAATGTLKWKSSLPNEYFVFSSPAVANGVVYVGGNDSNHYGRVIALNAATGTLKWNYRTGFWVHSSPAVVNGVVYVGNGDGNIYAIGTQTQTKTTALTATALATAYATQNIIFKGRLTSGTASLANQPIKLLRWNGAAYVDTGKRATTNAAGWYTLSRAETASGKYYYRTTYAGTATFTSAKSNFVGVTVFRLSTSLTLTASDTTPAVKQQVTFTAKLYRWNPTTRSYVPLANKPVTIYHYYKGVRYNDVTKKTDAYGRITFVQKFGSTGKRTYYATFAGDMSYKASTSGVLTITVH